MKQYKLDYKAALYMRLSKDDNNMTESSSIITQRKMLRAYSEENNFEIYDEYIDDGFSGTSFERPSFKRMICDIELGNVNLVITKDLSRLGRDYIQSGYFQEVYFPKNNVRYIAIDDGYDSGENSSCDIAPFKNILNEFYARDISKKIRSAFTVHMKEGSFVGHLAPYGYKKDAEDRHKLVIDEEAANIVRKIFDMVAEGKRPKEVAQYLNQNNVATPADYHYNKNLYLNVENCSYKKEWSAAGITKMLRNIVYLGHMAQGKTYKISFKSNATITKPKEDWIIVENTHEPIVSQELFDMAHRACQSRKQTKKGSFCNIFSGIAYCADCGKSMSITSSRKKGSAANLCCGGYKLYGKSACTNHFIDYNVLYNIVLKEIKKHIQISKKERKNIIEELITQKNMNYDEITKNITLLEFRKNELNTIIDAIYEDNILGKISETNYNRLTDKYQKEQRSLISRLEQYNKIQEEKNIEYSNDYNNFDIIIEQLLNINSLTNELMSSLINRIEIEQGYYEKTDFGKRKRQNIHIYFNFMGEESISDFYI